MDRVISMAERNTERFGTVESSGQPTEAVFSPDGHWVAYVAQELSSRAAVYA